MLELEALKGKTRIKAKIRTKMRLFSFCFTFAFIMYFVSIILLLYYIGTKNKLCRFLPPPRPPPPIIRFWRIFQPPRLFGAREYIGNLSILSLELMIRYDSCFFRIILSKELNQKINSKIFCWNFPVIFINDVSYVKNVSRYVNTLCLCCRSDAEYFAV